MMTEEAGAPTMQVGVKQESVSPIVDGALNADGGPENLDDQLRRKSSQQQVKLPKVAFEDVDASEDADAEEELTEQRNVGYNKDLDLEIEY